MRIAFSMALALLLGGVWGHTAQVKLETSLAHPTMRAGTEEKQTTYLKIGLQGFDLANEGKRAPVNLSIVIDKSGSMTGEKIASAKKAALEAVSRLNEDDIISIVAYDSTVTVLLPATKSSDKAALRRAIQQIEADGSTALFAGVSKGAAEVRKFKSDNRVNRVILLSDGLANVGPSSPEALEQLGSSLLEEGITVSTLGLGLDYNEDLMTKLAAASSGNHVFIESPSEIEGVFQNEFDEVLSVVAKDFEIRVKLNDGVRPVKLLPNSGEIDGQRVDIRLGQLYSKQQRFYMLEVEVPSRGHGEQLPIGTVEVTYTNMQTKTKDELSSRVAVRFDESAERVAADENADVITKCAILTCNERNRMATELRDRGETEVAKRLLLQNSTELRQLQSRYRDQKGYTELAPQLDIGIQTNDLQSEQIEQPDWKRSRKVMRETQNSYDQQQRFGGKGAYGAGEKADLFGGSSSSK